MRSATILLSAITLAAFLAARAPGAGGEVAPETVQAIQKAFSEANDHFKKKDHGKAVESCRRFIGLVPAGDEYDQLRLQGHYLLAMNHALLGQEVEAFGALDQAIDFGLLDPQALERNQAFESLRRSKNWQTLPAKMRKAAEAHQKKKMEKLGKFDFDLLDLQGKPLRKRDFLGQVLIVDIWGTWCPPCRMEIPHFIELQKRYGAQGLRIVGLNSEKVPPAEAPATVRKVIDQMKIPYPCAMASMDLLRSIPGFNSFPTTLFFGRDGTVRAMEVGARDLQALEAIVKPLLAEKAPAGPAPQGAAAGKDGAPPASPVDSKGPTK